MDNKKDLLRGFYKSIILPELQKLEKRRKFIVAKIVIGVVVPFIIITPILIFMFLNHSTNPLYVLMPMLVIDSAGAMFVYSQFGETSFYKSFKQNVIKKIIKFINPSLDYDNNLHVQIFDYNESKFFFEKPIEFYGDDHVSGQIQGVEIEFSELEARYSNPEDRKKYGKYQFKGLFFVANTYKKFPANVVIRSKGLADVRDEYLVDNFEYTELFSTEVLSNREQAGKILSKEFIALMVEYKRMVHYDICFSIIDSQIYVAFWHDKDLFEPNVLKPLVDYDMVTEYFNDLYYPLAIIEDFIKKQKSFQL